MSPCSKNCAQPIGLLDWVSLSKMGSWYLLIFVSFTTVTLVYRRVLITPDRRAGGVKGGRTTPDRR